DPSATTCPSYHSGPPAIGSSSKPGCAGSEAIGLEHRWTARHYLRLNASSSKARNASLANATLLLLRFRKVMTLRSLYPCCELLRRAFEPSGDAANSSLIGRKSQSEDDHGRPRPVPNCCRSATDVKRRSAP